MKSERHEEVRIRTSASIELCYEERGPAHGEVVLFVMGLSCQMVFWPEALLDQVAAAGYRVIRFDNRDVGRSTLLRCTLHYAPWQAALLAQFGRPLKVEYTLHDMVQDTVDLLDALKIDRAHLVGVSMGGMISQLMAARHPDRVRTLTSIMSTSNSRWLPPPRPAALMTLIGRRPDIRTREQYVAHGRKVLKAIGGRLPTSEALLDEIFGRSWERGIHPRGIAQQFYAILATGDLTSWIRTIRCPTTIIHGTRDPLLPPAHGRASARHIPGARMRWLKDMGHDLPDAALAPIAEWILENVRRPH